MDVLIQGAGIAGLTLAFWLDRLGHHPTIVEQSPRLRDEGYGLDFFGPGYEVAATMGLLADLERIHYPLAAITFVDGAGRTRASLDYATLRQKVLAGRHFILMRGDLERLLYTQLEGRVSVRFSTTLTSFEQDASHVHVRFSDGTSGDCDLLVGADGLHSAVRKAAFGPEEQFERFLGYHTAAYILDKPVGPRDAWTTLSVPNRQVGVYPVRGDRTATFFIHQARPRPGQFTPELARQELRAVYGDLGWIVPELLAGLDASSSLYFDRVSQIVLPTWSAGRVTLVGDGCGCVSLIAGQGASMAMAGAYALAQSLAAERALAVALARYERDIKPEVERKQRAGRRFARWFVPDSPWRVAFQAISLRAANIRVLAPLIRRQFGLGSGVKL
jgi:2-polyprenyl-6-methoxyphenol hydroxylase-like FAD-dependent oxidoreductase